MSGFYWERAVGTDFLALSRLREARNRYSYVPARLVASANGSPLIRLPDRELGVPENWQRGGVEVRSKYSSIELDAIHTSFLNSPDPGDMMHGLVSVVFWGHASGLDGRVNAARAFARARWIPEGKGKERPQDYRDIIRHLERARTFLDAKRLCDALREVMEIKHLGMSFGSKMLAFMNPTIAAVYDKRISEVLGRKNHSELAGLFVSTQLASSDVKKRQQAKIYARWCSWCANKANVLNEAAMRWVDWNRVAHRWRAVDVERALFTLSSNDNAQSRA